MNFGVARTGSICICTNEGNGRLVSALPRVHIAIMGMERVVPTLAELAVLLQLLGRSGTGQKLTAYTTLLTGPRRDGERDGPEEEFGAEDVLEAGEDGAGGEGGGFALDGCGADHTDEDDEAEECLE